MPPRLSDFELTFWKAWMARWYAMAGALSGITVYLAVRFRPSFAAGAAVATAHDLIVTVAALSLAGYELDLNVVAALLTVAGYSVNDTIVIFDRVRERLWSMGRGQSARL